MDGARKPPPLPKPNPNPNPTPNSEKLGFIIAGAPASGKGTQCKAISERYNVKHISTGDALRAQVKGKTALGMKAKGFMDAGDLVPDELVMNIVKAATEDVADDQGYLLDGVPRTMPQAHMLKDLGIDPSAFILLNVPDEILVERITGRRIDPVTGESYHVKFFPPPAGEIAARVYQRSDDTESALRTRLVKFHENVAAVKGFYSDVMVEVNGNQQKAVVQAEIMAGVDKLLAKKKHAH
uniref:Adenylate kinase active site lid domain-containing protein n=1 Tax=Phaeomonas parva TaxID=124430 RepID=A0A7S1UH67_9STRA|mmetsp:Transcript_5621/g.15711  ORF Transcript_5621/g.15711 Transcript_5621/m.15711 type:complete len:239 (+) Transcript_5621:3-719(+)|eukprot:CAMPEP_0118886868 /NCGR_PEP_ID=MMETSP1163-20130328/24805_1 /TAXON_ID=124430 /ORGANISM="Phaeomonas parva, Strain CCMP2877" /LENGTH=238 /DNA_ID=CAMNT_0006825193 /DNA_START=61 /DNA_END=777 /DNA_ORIENTATION=+